VGFDYFGERFTAACLATGTSSFADFLAGSAPHLLPGAAAQPGAPAPGQGTGLELPPGTRPQGALPHGTTIVAADFDGGVIMAGDRRSTAGNVIAQRDIEKVFRSDDYSCVGISGVAGIGLELVRLFQLELEHYEKLEGRSLSLEGKANRLSAFVRNNLGAAMQGRIFSYDAAGGRYEERNFHSIGSGSPFARGSLKKLYRDGMSADDAIAVCMQALYDAADDDSATGGPDLTRHIYPMVATITADGYRQLTDEEAGRYADAVVAERMRSPGGPTAPLPPTSQQNE